MRNKTDPAAAPGGPDSGPFDVDQGRWRMDSFTQENVMNKVGSDFRVGRKASRKYVVPLTRGRYAFTLVELLVVVAIIALLVSILLPTLGKAKEQAKIVVCMANLKGLSLGITYYAGDHDDWYPAAAGYGGDPPTWDTNTLYCYENKGLLHCPGDNLKRLYGTRPPEECYPRSYAFHWRVSYRGPSVYGESLSPPYGGNDLFPFPGYIYKTTDLAIPTDTILLGEMWESPYYNTGTIVSNIYARYLGAQVNDSRGRDVPTFYHRNNDATNFLFCDGRVDLLAENDRNITAETDYYYWQLKLIGSPRW